MTGACIDGRSRRRETAAAASLGAAAAGFAVGWNNTNVGAGADGLAAAYGVHVGAIGLMLTALLLCHVVLQLPAGRLIDRSSARSVGLAGLAIMTIGGLTAMTAADVAVGLAARAMTGCGCAMAFVAASAHIRDTGGGPLAQGVFGAANLAGAALAIVVVPRVGDVLGWRAPFVTAAVVGALAAVLMAMSGRAAPSATRSRAGMSVLRDAALYRVGLVHTVSFGFSIVIGSWIVVVIEAHSDLDAKTAGLVGALTLLGGILTRAMGGWVVQRHQDAVPAIVAVSMVVGGAGTAGLALSSSPAVLILAAAAVGLAGGMPFAPAFTAAASSRPDAPASAIALINLTAGVVALALAPIVGATLSVDPDARVGFLLIAVLWTASVVALPRDALRARPAAAATEGS